MENNNITRAFKGLHTDNSPQDQPKGTYRFALNGITETDNDNFISNEESNERCVEFPQNYVPIGKEYIGNNQNVIFLVNEDENLSEIGILDGNCNYETHVNFNLGFKSTNQIDATYRLRKGCERTIYFTDGLNKPRIYNFDKPEDFKTNDNWDINKFNLFKTYQKRPYFKDIKIEENGELLPGSYNFAIQYLDEDLNATEWITSSKVIIIYNDSEKANSFDNIRGSTNKKTDYQDFGVTNKSIHLIIDNLDTSFLFYRIAIIEANNGSGIVNNVYYSKEINTKNTLFVYSGNNYNVKGTEEEIAQFNDIITSAKHIEQIENRLLLSNTKGKQVNFCEYQKYASKIESHLVLQEVNINDLSDPNCPKREYIEKVGYMPGEVYSFGIVYVFKDQTTSPVYHIPGSGNKSDDISVYETTSFYTDNSSCEDYWGKDKDGISLKGEYIRHHKFPFRRDVEIPLVEKKTKNLTIDQKNLKVNAQDFQASVQDDTYTKVSVRFYGELPCKKKGTSIYCVYFELGYDESEHSSIFIAPDQQYCQNGKEVDNIMELGIFKNIKKSNLYISYKICNYPTYHTRKLKGLNHEIITGISSTSKTEVEKGFVGENYNYISQIMGVKFTNIELPKDVIGYYIVRNKRTEENKTVLDSVNLLPLVNKEEGKYIAHGLLKPKIEDNETLENIFAFIGLEHKFNNKEYKNVDTLINEDYYISVGESQLSGTLTQDVYPGTSYNSKVNKGKDDDGFSLNCLQRQNYLEIKKFSKSSATNAIEDIFYLNALSSKTTRYKKSFKDIYNLSSDNKIGIIKTPIQYYDKASGTYPIYVKKSFEKKDVLEKCPVRSVLTRKLKTAYSNFRTLPYYLEHNELKTSSTCEIYNGDSYISPLKYTSSIFVENKMADRKKKKRFWKIIAGVLSIIGGVALLATGVGLGAGISAISFGVAVAASGLKHQQMLNVYSDLMDKEEFNKNLKDNDYKCFEDEDKYDIRKGDEKPSYDDEIRWFHDIIDVLWFESSVNANWRVGSSTGMTDFLNVFQNDSLLTNEKYTINKLTETDTENDNGKTYQGFAKAELYEVNPDYNRTNTQKQYFHLGLEYDCCSKCKETFPHRINWSEQSFQEELTDNYRTFLSNNYKNIEGETGEITNLFKIQNNLYIHTEEALWHLPQNLQERVTDQIVSFIGTGEFFNMPPRLIIDGEDGNSAGCQHKWGTIKTPHGVFFVSENQGVIYQFNGNNLKPISANGMFNWFKNNIPIKFDKEYYHLHKKPFPYKDNISHQYGTGFISTYDSRKERVIFTKKERQIVLTGNSYDKSWTISYSLKSNPNSWQSWHSYLPNFYINTPEKIYSWIHGNNNLWKHNKKTNYQTFYGLKRPFIIEFVSLSNPLTTKVWDYLKLITEAKKFDENLNEFVEKRFTTFNKGIFYNSRQCSGILNLIVKDINSNKEDYLLQQVQNLNGNNIIIDRNEKDWTINELRDIRINYSEPIFNSNIKDLQNEYYIDKIINNDTINYNKDWTQLESFRDKYLIIRLIFDKFDDIKLLLNYSIENEKQSFR